MDPESNPAESAECFIQLLLDQYISSSLSAETVCTLAYWAVKAGMRGFVEKVARKPGMSTGNYAKALKQVLGFNDKHTYKLQVPGHSKHDPGRTSLNLCVQPLHEMLLEEVQETPQYSRRLMDIIEGDRMPPCYVEHRLFQESESPPFPYAIYMDGVAYSQVDSVLAVWAYSLVTGRRHLLALVRKKHVCQCGCRGWCTYWCVLTWLHWSCRTLHQGEYPTSRHDGAPWQEGRDSERETQAGQPMPYKACLVFHQGRLGRVLPCSGVPSMEFSNKALLLLLCLCRRLQPHRRGNPGQCTMTYKY